METLEKVKEKILDDMWKRFDWLGDGDTLTAFTERHGRIDDFISESLNRYAAAFARECVPEDIDPNVPLIPDMPIDTWNEMKRGMDEFRKGYDAARRLTGASISRLYGREEGK